MQSRKLFKPSFLRLRIPNSLSLLALVFLNQLKNMGEVILKNDIKTTSNYNAFHLNGSTLNRLICLSIGFAMVKSTEANHDQSYFKPLSQYSFSGNVLPGLIFTVMGVVAIAVTNNQGKTLRYSAYIFTLVAILGTIWSALNLSL